jgi:hypothetical protein
MQKPWMNLRGPARMVAISATVLLVASGMLGVEAGLMIVLGSGRDMVLKPFTILGYLEVSAIFFALLGIVAGVLGLIFYHPYRYISDSIFFYRARRAGEVSNDSISFEDARPAQGQSPEDYVWRD